MGLLSVKTEPTIGVSLDCMAEINILDMSKQVLCVEIKTRVAANTVDLVESAMRQHGRIAWCCSDDAIFNDCVPLGNRGKIIHQECVTNFNHGIFVTAKVEEGEGSIIQTIIVKIYNEWFKKILRSIVSSYPCILRIVSFT